MDIFNIHSQIVADYQSYIRSFIRIEDDADDYVIHCRFGTHLANGLNNLIEAGERHFNSDVNRRRIDRIRSSPKPNLYFR